MITGTNSFRNFIQDQLQGLDGVVFRRMFGGYGLYHGAVFFGILHKDRLYFRTDDATRPAYVDRGMQPFRPNAKQTLKSYYEIPAEVLDDAETLVTWARNALVIGAETSARRRVSRRTRNIKRR